ncbi:hypothetical protein D3870_12175 [Noviherbaspirillum cavernae]|uniref:Uncharacterized protein n=1 Tax=Noviherbaspirillum cavernae TaxID=2320862 RepID=A0A418X2K5_9BURK|nr:hypothetical protein D3870_12175 [Noviherbaspirillum cavernae]
MLWRAVGASDAGTDSEIVCFIFLFFVVGGDGDRCRTQPGTGLHRGWMRLPPAGLSRELQERKIELFCLKVKIVR